MKAPVLNRKIDRETAQLWIVGGGIAGMSVAAFAIRDGKIPPANIHILEETPCRAAPSTVASRRAPIGMRG